MIVLYNDHCDSWIQ